MNIRIGNGIDVHALVTGRSLVLGGVTIPFERGLKGHSDADALLHAICDAVLGALGEGDIGARATRTPTAESCCAPYGSVPSPGVIPSAMSTPPSSPRHRSLLLTFVR